MSARLTPEEETAERSAILITLHQFARATGALVGEDVVRWFDSRLRMAAEKDLLPRITRAG